MIAIAVLRSSDSGHACTADRKSTRLNSSHSQISYAVFCLKKKKRLSRPRSKQTPLIPPLALAPSHSLHATSALLPISQQNRRTNFPHERMTFTRVFVSLIV